MFLMKGTLWTLMIHWFSSVLALPKLYLQFTNIKFCPFDGDMQQKVHLGLCCRGWHVWPGGFTLQAENIAVSEMCGFFGTGILSQTYANQYQT